MLCSRDIAIRKKVLSFFDCSTCMDVDLTLCSFPFEDVNTLEYGSSACTGNNPRTALCGWPTVQADKLC